MQVASITQKISFHALVFGLILILCSCGQVTGESSAEPDLNRQDAWKSYLHNDFHFQYPEAWHVMSQNDNQIILKSTDKQIVLGGVAPDDYYMQIQGKSILNEGKYAREFVCIEIKRFEAKPNQNLAMFISTYPESGIANYDFYPIAQDHPSLLEMVFVTEINMVNMTDSRFLARTADYVYDISFIGKGIAFDQVSALYSDFMNRFSF